LNRQVAKAAKEAAKKSRYRNAGIKAASPSYNWISVLIIVISVSALLGGFLGGLGGLAVQNCLPAFPTDIIISRLIDQVI